ncbi:MAG: hypothetical protein Q4E64_00730 [Phascolarctobacterium sp.]|uniref:hypothetical protein n=1 Tax=Phascolarctobacterium sp. TaxID=2049039 RepID=UPI0026DB53B2|nr:hypothetical protein [Phascolarctobacterium sp.]MDO4920344.1 hypothetical protein [Phascolarctobacterium sp.]
MFRKDKWFKAGWFYFIVMFVLEAILPEWVGDENGVIENLQMLWLFGGLYYCYKMRICPQQNWGGKASFLWNAGMIYYFLLIMREINWGRALLTNPDGSSFQYSQMGLYGKLVHPMVAVLILILLVALYKAKVWRALTLVRLPTKSFFLLLLFIFMSWVGEKANFTGFHGQVGEELAEFGAYMMMYYIVRDMGGRLRK